LLGKESYYHVQVALVEYDSGTGLHRTYSVVERLGSALLWALAWWSAAALAVGVLAVAYLSVRTLAPGGLAHGEQGTSPANHYFTFSNAQKSEIVGTIPEPLAVLLLAHAPTPHFFTFSFFHPSASWNLHMLGSNFGLRGSHNPG
jgi:hypothetical protein